MIIYKLTSPSGKSYIGQTQRGLETRLQEHYTRSGSTINAAFQKYPDLNKWDISTLCECETVDQLNEAEIKFIEQFDTYHNGYNDTKGGEGFVRDSITEEHKTNISQSRRDYFQSPEGLEWKKVLSERFLANNPTIKGRPSHNKGKKQSDYMTPEQIEEWRRQHDAREYSEEYRDAQRDRMKARWANGEMDNRPPPSRESVQKRIETNKKNGFKQTDHQKAVASEFNKTTYLVSWSDGRPDEVVRGMKEFSKSSGIPYSTVSYCVTFSKDSPKWKLASIKILDSKKRITRATVIET